MSDTIEYLEEMISLHKINFIDIIRVPGLTGAQRKWLSDNDYEYKSEKTHCVIFIDTE